MRLRMQKERSGPPRRRFRAAGAEEPKPQEVIDLKLGDGGIVEAEFLVQYLLIRHGHSVPAIRTTSTRRALAALAHADLLKKATAERVIRAYDRLRTLQNWLRIAHDETLDHLDLSDETLRPLALATGYAGDSAATLLRRDLIADTAAIHLCYEEVLGI
jgi:glutamate-ammonia-ligase adenylyltransferase